MQSLPHQRAAPHRVATAGFPHRGLKRGATSCRIPPQPIAFYSARTIQPRFIALVSSRMAFRRMSGT